MAISINMCYSYTKGEYALIANKASHFLENINIYIYILYLKVQQYPSEIETEENTDL